MTGWEQQSRANERTVNEARELERLRAEIAACGRNYIAVAAERDRLTDEIDRLKPFEAAVIAYGKAIANDGYVIVNYALRSAERDLIELAEGRV